MFTFTFTSNSTFILSFHVFTWQATINNNNKKKIFRKT